MIKYFCDRCGKEMNYIFKVTVEPPAELRSKSWKFYILCYDCVKELSKFISKGELI